MSNFQDKARLAASAVSTMNPAEALAKSLTSEQPKIDSAIKSFMSLCAARSLSASDPNMPNYLSLHDAIVGTESNETKMETKKCFFSKGKNPQQAALLCARSLLKAINSFVIPPSPPLEDKSSNKKDVKEGNGAGDDEDKKFEFEVVRIVWNRLVKNKQKPTMFLGQTSLSHVFPLLKESCFQVRGTDEESNSVKTMFPKNVDLNEAQIFIDEFGDLLVCAQKRKNIKLSDEKDKNSKKTEKSETIHSHKDDDSCLLWDIDGGKSELERRRKRRESKSAATAATLKENDGSKETSSNTGSGLTIEEIEE